MVSPYKFRLIDNKLFHDKLDKMSEDTNPICSAMGVVFDNLQLDGDAKLYYPFFFREPYSLKHLDFCSLIDPDHLVKLKDRTITPLVCMISESWPLLHFGGDRIFKNSPYYNIISQLVRQGIKEEDVVWLICNRYQPSDARVKAKFIHADFYLEQQKLIETEFMPLTKIDNKFVSLARGTPKHHRFGMTYMLYANNLLRHGAVSCRGYKNFRYMESPTLTDQYLEKFEKFDSDLFNKFKATLPMVMSEPTVRLETDDPGPSPINLHQDARDESHLFRNSFLNVVNETHQQDDLVFITEKTYRSINYCRPFVINGDKGSLRYLKDMGFQTFEKFWDESYDEATSDHIRINKIIEIVKHIVSLADNELLDLFQDMLPIIKHNYNVLKNYEQWDRLN